MRRRTARYQAAVVGSAAQIGLSTLLTMLEMERRTGVIELRGPLQTGHLCLRQGRVVEAQVHQSELRGRYAVYELLRWTDAEFAFYVREVPSKTDEVSLATTHLLLEAAVLTDERAA